MPVEFRGRITRKMLQDEPLVLFVFGDNMARKGFGGQASEMRGEPNAVGLPTKHNPYTHPSSYFTDEDLDHLVRTIRRDVARLEGQLLSAGKVVWPLSGIGTGFAQLAKHAPMIEKYYTHILRRFQSL